MHQTKRRFSPPTLVGVNAVGVQGFGRGLATRGRWHRRVAVHGDGRGQGGYGRGCDGGRSAGTCAKEGFKPNTRALRLFERIVLFISFLIALRSFDTSRNYAKRARDVAETECSRLYQKAKIYPVRTPQREIGKETSNGSPHNRARIILRR